MSVFAIIPARGGSKGILRKNLQVVGGLTLISRAVKTCLAARSIDTVFVSTDSDEIAAEAVAAGAKVIERPAELSGDTNSSEEAILHALEVMENMPEIVVFAQCTSPFTRSSDLENAVRIVKNKDADVAFSVVPNKHFLWQQGSNSLEPVGHPSNHRPRRQDLAFQYMETGNFYCFRSSGVIAAKYRFHGRVAPVVISEAFALEIDEELDLAFSQKIEETSGRAR